MLENRHNSAYEGFWRLNFRRAIPIQKTVAVVLWRLANGHSHITTSRTLAVGKSAAIEITADFCEEMRQLSPLFISFPRARRKTSKAI